MIIQTSQSEQHQNRHRRITRRRIGGAVLETVLVLPILLYLAFGIVEFGYYFYVKHSLEGAARDGCRAFIASGAAYSDITTAVSNSMTTANLGSSGYTVTVTDTPAGGGSAFTVTGANYASCVAGDSISVVVNATWGTAGQGYRPWNLIGSNKTVSGNAVMMKEG
jgi:Flp pilus assembly protein TadG